ncbi:protein THALLO isoform X3 [Henckelia pumila]|uniref:protein THALLO isoform X3 n=1 Tax=Henckelia pumila TaxID=405737 RepID=UPI003C6E8666
MGRKGGKYKRKESSGPAKKKAIPFHQDGEDMMNDEIDAFHKQRDVVPMRLEEDMEESEEDEEQSVLNIEDEEDEDDVDEDEDGEMDDPPSKGFTATLQRTRKNLRAMYGEGEDEIFNDAHEEQERIPWAGKEFGYGADVRNEPLSTDDEDAAEEEAEVLKLQSEKAKALSMEDYGLGDTGQDLSDAEPTLEEISNLGKPALRPFDQVTKDETGLVYEIVKKDINALTKEEQMDVVYSSAPELVGLLSELKDALEQLENKINPLVNKPDEKPELTELNITGSAKNIDSRQKRQDAHVGVESLEMLRVRAALEEKLKQKGVLSSSKNVRKIEHLEPVNGKLETMNDFDDEATELDRRAYGKSNMDKNISSSSKLSQQVYLRPTKRQVISGDDDIPKRDDIGERRRKHELRVLAGAGITSVDNLEDATGNFSSDGVAEVNGESAPDSDLEYYKQVEQQHAAKLAAKSNKYFRTPEVSSLPDDAVDGKRLITRQMEKNRGLTRARKKLIKNPRKKYKLKHQKAEVRRKGQVREVRKPTGPYGGEATGINAGISRSIRFKS